MHGGCIATILDFCTAMSTTLISRPGFWFTGGVSSTLNLTYVRPIPCGKTVLVECEAVKVGQVKGVLKGTIRGKTDGAVMAICLRGMVNTDPRPKSNL